MVSDLELEAGPGDHVGVRGCRVVHRQAHAKELLGGLVGQVAEMPLGNLAHLWSAELLEHREGTVRPELREAARHDQLRREIGIARGDGERDNAAERLAKDHRPFQPERLAEVGDVGNPVIEVPLRNVVAVAPPLPAMVEQHELRDVGQRRERRREA